MEREQIIEEIATCFCGYYGDKTDECYSYLRRPLCKETDCIYKRKVADIVNKHIPEGAVVLTREEQIRQAEKRSEAVGEIVRDAKEQARKETAREILQEIWLKSTSFDEDYDGDLTVEWDGLLRKDFEAIVDKYGVEVEE